MRCVLTPRIMPRTCLESHVVTVQPRMHMHSLTLPRFQSSTSITAVNVRTCLCLCNCLVYTRMPCVVCINCGWVGLKGQFIKTSGGCQEQTREWKERNLCQVLTDCEESFEERNSDVINIFLLYFCLLGQSSSWSAFIVMEYDCADIRCVFLF